MKAHRILVPDSWRELARLLLFSGLAGAGVSLLFWLMSRDAPLPLQLAMGAYVGMSIYGATLLFGWLLGARLASLSGRSLRMVLALVFFAAGVGGWLVATATLPILTLGRVRLGSTSWRSALMVEGGLGLAVGLAIYTYESLRRNLATSIARLKETEFAEKELETARDIQRRLLPPPTFAGEGFRLAAGVEPAGLVGGDFYDYFRLTDGRLVVVVADVAGKGMGASLLMASAKAMLVFVASSGRPETMLDALNDRLVETLGNREFVALAVVLFDPVTGGFELANAGLPDPYLVDAERGPVRAVVVDGPRLPLGMRRGIAYGSAKGTLGRGDRLALVTDGLPEAPQLSSGEPLGYPALEAQLPGIQATGESIAQLFAAVAAASVSPRVDDWTALVLERTG
jgi:sigma-B regulation protein RsbU (phosphoserine phosphatase)